MANNDRSELYIVEFADTLGTLSQQTQSRLQGLVMTGNHVGKQASPIEFVGDSSVFQVTARGESKVIEEVDHSRRWVNQVSWSTPPALVDNFDDVRTKIDPSGPYARNQVYAHMRKRDDQIIDAFFDDAITGETATGTTSFSAGNVVAAGAAGLTLAKLLEGLQLLQQNEVDMDHPETMIGCCITPAQHTQLIQISQVSNTDFGNTVFDGEGLIKKWYGINFVVSNRLEDAAGIRANVNPGASATRAIPMWAKSGMHLGLWEDIKGDIKEDPTRIGNPPLITTTATSGATRTEEEKVIKIVIDETA